MILDLSTLLNQNWSKKNNFKNYRNKLRRTKDKFKSKSRKIQEFKISIRKA